jgi:hypothetical protein
MLLRLVARPSDAEPELPFWRDAPFRDAPFGRDAPFRAALARDGVVCFGDVVRLADVERLADVVRRFWVVPPLRAVDRFAVFVAGSEPEVVVFRRVAELDFLVVAIGFSHPEALFHLPGSATQAPAVSNRRAAPR